MAEPETDGMGTRHLPFYKDLRVVVPALVVLVGAVIGPLLTLWLSGKTAVPEVATVLPNELRVGEQFDVSGKNLHLVSEVSLTKGTSPPILLIHRIANSRTRCSCRWQLSALKAPCFQCHAAVAQT